ncbi:uncharacterized protein [Ptychodera flava]|uniref:uncharacterized protein n=1 Tax=Ptychodera flava TaxID=63121 RepID=UPI003969FE88
MEELQLEYEEQKLRNAELQHEILIVRANINKLMNDIKDRAKNIEKHHLEMKWGPNGTEEEGMDPQQETETLVEQLVEIPEMLDSVLSSLKHRQAKMNAEIIETRSKLQQLMEDG